MEKFFWHTQAALTWLQTILQERFGHVFVLQPHTDDCSIDLRLPDDTRYITLALDEATFTRTDWDLPCTRWNSNAEGWSAALPGDLPAPGATQLSLPLITRVENGWYIGYDILGLTYWMLTRMEEVGRVDLDRHGRFPAVNSHAYRHNYLERPIVDEWLHILGQVIVRTWPNIKLKQHHFGIKVSHDVDAPSRYGFCNLKGLLRTMAIDLIRYRSFKNLMLAPLIRMNTKEIIHPKDPFNTFDLIMDTSESNGLRSAFYFICGSTSNMDADYELENPAILQLMRRINQRGHEIGIHPSYGTYKKSELIVKEAQHLRLVLEKENIHQKTIGGRMHYLRWEHPTTLRAWAAAGMEYDSTLSYADHPGFRCGTCFEYPAFDPLSGEQLKIRIRPLIMMECSVIDECYLGLGTKDDAKNKIDELKNVCRAVQGCFTVLWHNSRLVLPEEYVLFEHSIK